MLGSFKFTFHDGIERSFLYRFRETRELEQLLKQAHGGKPESYDQFTGRQASWSSEDWFLLIKAGFQPREGEPELLHDLFDEMPIPMLQDLKTAVIQALASPSVAKKNEEIIESMMKSLMPTATPTPVGIGG